MIKKINKKLVTVMLMLNKHSVMATAVSMLVYS